MAGDYYIAIEQYDHDMGWIHTCTLDDVWSTVCRHLELKARVFDWSTCSPEVRRDINYTCQLSEPLCLELGGGYRMIIYSEM